MVKGYIKPEGIEYEEMLSSIVRFTFIHLILAVIAYLDLKLYLMNVETEFFNGELDEKICME